MLFFILVGAILLLSAEKRTKRSNVCGLSSRFVTLVYFNTIVYTCNADKIKSITLSTLKKTNFGFGYVFLIGSMYKQKINFNQSIKQCCINNKKYAFLLKVISLWIKVNFAISWRKVKIWLTSTNVKF